MKSFSWGIAATATLIIGSTSLGADVFQGSLPSRSFGYAAASVDHEVYPEATVPTEIEGSHPATAIPGQRGCGYTSPNCCDHAPVRAFNIWQGYSSPSCQHCGPQGHCGQNAWGVHDSGYTVEPGGPAHCFRPARGSTGTPCYAPCGAPGCCHGEHLGPRPGLLLRSVLFGLFHVHYGDLPGPICCDGTPGCGIDCGNGVPVHHYPGHEGHEYHGQEGYETWSGDDGEVQLAPIEAPRTMNRSNIKSFEEMPADDAADEEEGANSPMPLEAAPSGSALQEIPVDDVPADAAFPTPADPIRNAIEDKTDQPAEIFDPSAFRYFRHDRARSASVRKQ